MLFDLGVIVKVCNEIDSLVYLNTLIGRKNDSTINIHLTYLDKMMIQSIQAI